MSGECCCWWETRLGKEAKRERKGPNLGASGTGGQGDKGPPWAGGLQEILRLGIWAGDEEGRAPKHLECCYPSDQ